MDTKSVPTRGPRVATPTRPAQKSSTRATTPLEQRRLAQAASVHPGLMRELRSAPVTTALPKEALETQIDEEARTLGWLSYLGLALTGLLMLNRAKRSSFVRFHAWQSILATAATLLIGFLLYLLPGFTITSGLLGIVAFFGWLVLLYSAYQGQRWQIPLLGTLAGRLASKKPAR